MNCLGHFGGCGITPPIWSLINYTYQTPPPNNLSSPGIDSNASEQIKKHHVFSGKKTWRKFPCTFRSRFMFFCWNWWVFHLKKLMFSFGDFQKFLFFNKNGGCSLLSGKKVEWKQEVQQNSIYLLRQNCWVQSYLKWQSKLEDVKKSRGNNQKKHHRFLFLFPLHSDQRIQS